MVRYGKLCTIRYNTVMCSDRVKKDGKKDQQDRVGYNS